MDKSVNPVLKMVQIKPELVRRSDAHESARSEEHSGSIPLSPPRSLILIYYQSQKHTVKKGFPGRAIILLPPADSAAPGKSEPTLAAAADWLSFSQDLPGLKCFHQSQSDSCHRHRPERMRSSLKPELDISLQISQLRGNVSNECLVL